MKQQLVAFVLSIAGLALPAGLLIYGIRRKAKQEEARAKARAGGRGANTAG